MIWTDNDDTAIQDMKTPMVLANTVSDAITCFDDYMSIDNSAPNYRSAPHDCAGKKNGVPHVCTGFQYDTRG